MKTQTQVINKMWSETQDQLADKHGVAMVVIDENSTVIHKSNNNSMCQNLYSSEKFSLECGKYCGKAFAMAFEAEGTVEYKCYAGLVCRAVPIKRDENIQFVAIVGRTFTKAANYRQATERVVSGDWAEFSPKGFFENTLLKSSAGDLENISRSIEDFDDEKKRALLEFAFGKPPRENAESAVNHLNKPPDATINNEPAKDTELDQLIAEFHHAAAPPAIISEKINQSALKEAEIAAAWRSMFGSLLNLSYLHACASIVEFISKKYELNSLAWLERRGDRLVKVSAAGSFAHRPIQISISADDERLAEAARKETSVELQTKNDSNEPENSRSLPVMQLFPITIGGEIRSAMATGDEIADQKMKRQIARFCQNIASELEILRLREELARRGWLENAIRKLNENLNDIDAEDFWARLTQIPAELMRAERSSLLLFDEKSDSLTVKAAIGSNADAIKNERENLGERVAQKVLHSGKSLVVADIDKIGLKTAPLGWNYKSKSFISYPLAIGTRKIGVLNLTDKSDGESYNDFDVELLNAILPHFAVLIDRAALKHKAGEFEQLSVTDALTGLLNRRYLEERLAEEIKRSNRHGFPMSFMMIDVDDFKSYNDNFSHPEGDKALKLVAHLLKDTLRGADVAARYGGEEFSILLPQTTSDETKIIAERIRENIEKAVFPMRRVTVSIGIASCSQIICNAQEIIAAADKALYSAKRHGRNNVQIFEEKIDDKE